MKTPSKIVLTLAAAMLGLSFTTANAGQVTEVRTQSTQQQSMQETKKSEQQFAARKNVSKRQGRALIRNA
jgi:hypothetical protein